MLNQCLLLILCFFYTFPFALQAQNSISSKVYGKVINSETKEAIPFANISVEGKYRGTSSNILGEFVLRVDSLPNRLVVSHISYLSDTVAINSYGEELTVLLTPKESTLEEVLVKSGRTDPRAYRIMEKALKQLNKNNNINYGRAFYRQKSQNDSVYSELYEMFFDTRFSQNGIEDWALQEGRYALKDGGKSGKYIFNKNFTLLNRVFPTVQPQTEAYVMPMRYDWYNFYDMIWEESLEKEENQIAILRFQAKTEYNYSIPIMEGKLFIDLATFNLLKLEGEIVDDNLELVSLTSNEGYWENYKVTYEVAFNPSDSLGLLLDYIRTGQAFDYLIEGKFQKRVTTEAQLTFYEYYKPKKFKRLGGRLRYDRSDIDRIERINYDRSFWEDNPIVKRTPVEEEVIASFEKDREFGSIFLNNLNQVSLMPELDSDSKMQQLISQLGLHLRTQEKVYLHLDKPYYTPGESVWFKAYLFDALNHILGYTRSQTLYVDLISPSGELLEHIKLPVERGMTKGDFALDSFLPSGNYLVRAYTNWMRNFSPDWYYTQEIAIYSKEEVLEESGFAQFDSTLASLQFFPEGGDLVEKVPTQVGFKATNRQGLGVPVEGIIVDNNNNPVTSFESLHAGMGSLFFTPREGKTYKAIVDDPDGKRSFSLPKIKKKGYGIMVNNTKANSVSIRVVCSENLDNTEVYLVGQMRGKVYYKGKGKLNRRVLQFEIPRQIIPSGVLHLTLFSNRMMPQAERLVFINYAQDLHIEVKTNHKRYKARSKVKVDITVTNAEGKPVEAVLSMSATDAGQVTVEEQRESILSNLLLTSDIKGEIENPAFYFKDQMPNTKRALDALMLTQGWRRFTWNDVLDLEEVRVMYPYEQGFSFGGEAFYAETEKPFDFKQMYLTALGKASGLWATETRENGEFTFRNLNFYDSAELVIQGNWADQQKADILLKVDTLVYPEILYEASPITLSTINREELVNYLEKDEERKRINRAFDEPKTIMLDEVKVASTRQITESKILRLHSSPDATIDADDNLNMGVTNVLEMLNGRVAGVRVTGTGPDVEVSIRGAGTPLVLIDGMPINSPGASALGFANDNTIGGTGGLGNAQGASNTANSAGANVNTGLEAVLTLSPSDIDRIEVLKNAANTSIYGMMGGNGVIAIYTKQGAESENNIPLSVINYVGYYSAREFYSPQYNIPRKIHAKPDKRATLHWEPFIQTNKQGKASVSFFNSDEAEHFQLVIEGTNGFGTLGTTVFDTVKKSK